MGPSASIYFSKRICYLAMELMIYDQIEPQNPSDKMASSKAYPCQHQPALPEYRASKKTQQRFQLPILNSPNKIHIPESRIISLPHVVYNKAPFLLAIQYSLGKDSLRDMSPHHASSQNLTLVPSPTSNVMNVENLAQPRCIYFQSLTPYGPLEGVVHQPPSIEPCFTSTTCLRNDSLSNPNLQSHFPNKASLQTLNFSNCQPTILIRLACLFIYFDRQEKLY